MDTTPKLKLPKGFIQVTNLYSPNNPKPLILNINGIGDIYKTTEERTHISTTTHNNGGFDCIKETVEEVLNKIIEAQK